MACPVGALHEKDNTQDVWNALGDPTKHVVVQPAPAVRVALGEEFDMPMGPRVTGKLAAALRRLGFDKVFDTDYGADLTIMEEGTELLNRIKNGGVLPMITSCSPGCTITLSSCRTCLPASLRTRCWARSSRATTLRPTTSIPRTSTLCPSCLVWPRSSRHSVPSCLTAAFRMLMRSSPPVSWPA